MRPFGKIIAQWRIAAVVYRRLQAVQLSKTDASKNRSDCSAYKDTFSHQIS